LTVHCVDVPRAKSERANMTAIAAGKEEMTSRIVRASALKTATTSPRTVDLDAHRLRRLVERLVDLGMVEVHDEPVPLTRLSAIVDASNRAILFRRAGPEGFEIVARAAGSRERMAVAYGVEPDKVQAEVLRRIDTPQPIFFVPSSEAPVHEVVLTGSDIDLSKLPFYPHHQYDGSPYINSGIDYVVNPETGLMNIGARRLSLRSTTQLGTNLTAPSDLRNIYRKCAARGEPLAVSFTCGAWPTDLLAAAGLRAPRVDDEIELVARMRGAPLALVRSLTNEVPVPADAEMVIEGYLDGEGYREPEGPYGEYMGYYGAMHLDPVFHVTAICMRKDVMHQTLLNGSGKHMDRTDGAGVFKDAGEAQMLRRLRSLGFEVVKVCLPGGAGAGHHLRVAMRPRNATDSRALILAVFAMLSSIKHVFVVDDDIDVYADNQMEWAMSTRFQADRDLIVQPGMAPNRMDPSSFGQETATKAGFDCTVPFSRPFAVTTVTAEPPVFDGPARFQTVRQALETGPMFFAKIMESVGSDDGREIALALHELRSAGELVRDPDGRYLLGHAKKGATGLSGPAHD
jgi:UbiD family decarboxylase